MSGDHFGEFEEAAELLQQVMGELYPEPGDVQARLAEMEAHEALGSFGTRSEDRRVVAYSGRAGQKAGQVRDVPVIAGNVRWERPTARSFWNALTDSERNALAAAGVEEVFRAGSVLCREGDDSSDVMIIDSGWVKVSVKFSAGAEAGEKIVAVRGQGDLIGERAALTMQVRSATVTALDEVSAMAVHAERFAEFLRGHHRAAEVLERQVVSAVKKTGRGSFPVSGAARSGAWRGCYPTSPSAGAATSRPQPQCSRCRCRGRNSQTGLERPLTPWAGFYGHGVTAGLSCEASGHGG